MAMGEIGSLIGLIQPAVKGLISGAISGIIEGPMDGISSGLAKIKENLNKDEDEEGDEEDPKDCNGLSDEAQHMMNGNGGSSVNINIGNSPIGGDAHNAALMNAYRC